jgi:hypothetical protein
MKEVRVSDMNEGTVGVRVSFPGAVIRITARVVAVDDCRVPYNSKLESIVKITVEVDGIKKPAQQDVWLVVANDKVIELGKYPIRVHAQDSYLVMTYIELSRGGRWNIDIFPMFSRKPLPS